MRRACEARWPVTIITRVFTTDKARMPRPLPRLLLPTLAFDTVGITCTRATAGTRTSDRAHTRALLACTKCHEQDSPIMRSADRIPAVIRSTRCYRPRNFREIPPLKLSRRESKAIDRRRNVRPESLRGRHAAKTANKSSGKIALLFSDLLILFIANLYGHIC